MASIIPIQKQYSTRLFTTPFLQTHFNYILYQTVFKMKISLITGGKDPHYCLGLLSGLSSNNIDVDFIGSKEMEQIGIPKNRHIFPYILYENNLPGDRIIKKLYRVIRSYIRLFLYAIKTDSRVFHIQWENKFIFFDWIILNMFYKILNKRIVFTAHNVNAGIRDNNDSSYGRFQLSFLYNVVDHIIVHTDLMKKQLSNCFNTDENKVSVVNFGINNVVPKTKLNKIEARNKLGLKNEKVILFFGNIAPYKGLEHLVKALSNLKNTDSNIRLIIAGRIKSKCEQYWKSIIELIKLEKLSDIIIQRIEFIPDSDIEIYCKASDVMVLPYTYIFQSGILFLAYDFGLPVIATDVGEMRENIIEGSTGYVCKPHDPKDLSDKLSLLFNNYSYWVSEEKKSSIIAFANEKFSWDSIGKKTSEIYRKLGA